MYLKQKLKEIYKIYWRTVQYYSNTKKEATIRAGDKVAEINFGEFLLNMDRGRYSFTICQILKFSGFEVIVKVHPKFFIKKETYRKWLLAQDFKCVRNTSAETGSIELHGSGKRKTYLFSNKRRSFYVLSNKIRPEYFYHK